MTIDLKKFAALQKASKESFFQQKKLVKQVMAGQVVICPQCQQPLRLFTPELTAISTSENTGVSGIRCVKGCTDIQLDFV